MSYIVYIFLKKGVFANCCCAVHVSGMAAVMLYGVDMER